MLIEAVIQEFRRQHPAPPRAVLVTPEAAVLLALRETLPPIYDGIPCRVVREAPPAVKAGTGNVVVVVMTTLGGGTTGATAYEAVVDSIPA